MDEGLTAEALDDFFFAANLIPSNQEPHIFLARLYANKGDVDGAIQALRRAVKARPLSLELLSDYPEFGAILGSNDFIVFLNDALGVDVLPTATKMRTRYAVLTVQALSQTLKPIRTADVSGGDTYWYGLEQRMSMAKESYPCDVSLEIEDSFRRRDKSVQIDVTKTYSFSMGSVDPARLRIREEVGPTEAITLLASKPNDQPTLPDRWVIELSSKDGSNSFVLDKHTRKSWAPGMFSLGDSSQTTNKRFTFSSIIAYAGRNQAEAQRTLSHFSRGIQICNALKNAN